ncbi:HD-GYP domain-containing protein [Halobacillus salinarum]|uniref:HD-GYP domain-containing protein n=1 Tax=Halobacillus salinarum TaxID=2932257 RepID=A0ABY4ENS5_9BACI|nr:HD-GYP domain-containing protein [Halobacillus salinarum]UOQ46035.1 HD-GYP domain-containing protein [Halobacillus salinarum]
MRLIETKALQPGQELAKPIYNDGGQALLKPGVTMTPLLIQKLMDYSITYVYIEDAATEDIISQYPITDALRNEAVASIKTAFQEVFKSDQMNRGFVFDKIGSQMMDVVRSIIHELSLHKEVISLLSDVFVYDEYIFSHSLNVTMYSLALGMELNLHRNKLEEIGLGAILHDVGKIEVPRDILHKPAKLTKEEFTVVKNHTDAGFQILRNAATIPLTAAHCAYQHHERLDGSGYPRGLVEEDIHLYGKLLAVADVFDAVTSNRSYRPAMLPHEGLEILYAGSGSLFDQRMVEAFRRCIAVYPNGLTVELNDGRTGVVVRQNPYLCDRPVVRIFEEKRNPVTAKYEIDLSEQLNLVVKNCDTTFLS